MTTVTNKDIQVLPIEVKTADRIAESNGSIRPFEIPKTGDGLTIIQYSSELQPIIGPSPTQSLLLSTTETSKNPFFHEACVFLPAHDELYITSNLLQSSSTSLYPTILISRIKLTRSPSSLSPNVISKLEWAKLRPPQGIDMPNGGVNYKEGLLFCAQGSPAPGTGGIYYMPRSAPPVPIITNFYGRDFNSVNDVVVSKRDGSIWFTDPCYGYEQGFRRRPELPNQIYRFDAEGSGEVRVMAGEWERCNGLCFSPGEERLYVTDTGVVHGDGGRDLQRPATIYVFDVIYPESKGKGKSLNSTSETGIQPYLSNRRTFAYATQGVPDGIKCDTKGNVYSGTDAGIEIWNLYGSLIGKIVVPGGQGCANFGFGREGEVFICGEQRLWWVQLNSGGEGEEGVRGRLVGGLNERGFRVFQF